MTQSKKKSVVETIVQTLSGLVISFFIQIIIYPALDIPVTLPQNFIITAVFFVASLVRGYVVRRIFTKI
jgi:hypothetical protein